MTDYIILRKDPEEAEDFPEAWYHLGGVYRASSGKRALHGAALTIPGDYVAVPYRSWRPLTVKTEQTTKVTIT